jgi:hypothetical protein
VREGGRQLVLVRPRPPEVRRPAFLLPFEAAEAFLVRAAFFWAPVVRGLVTPPAAPGFRPRFGVLEPSSSARRCSEQ